MKRVALCAVLLALAPSAFGQGMDFQQLISGKDIPLSLTLKDLNSDWRRISISSMDSQKGGPGDMMSQLIQLGAMSETGTKDKNRNDAAAAMVGMSLLSGLFGRGGDNKESVYYTRGQTVTMGGETFIVACRHQKKEMNLMQMAMAAEKNGGKEPDLAKIMADNKLSPESPLTIALVNIKRIGSLSGIRPFDMNQEIQESAEGGGGLMDLIAAQAAKEEKGEGKTDASANKTTTKKTIPAKRK